MLLHISNIYITLTVLLYIYLYALHARMFIFNKQSQAHTEGNHHCVS